MCAIVIMTARGLVSVVKKAILQRQARSLAQLARDGRRDGVFGGPHPVWHSDGCVFKVVVGAVKVIIGVEIGFIVDDVANAAGYGPIVVSKIYDGRAGVRNQINVIRRGVRLIKSVGKIHLHVKPGDRIPVKCLTNYMLLDYTGLLLGQRFTFDKPLAIDCRMHKIVSSDQRKCTKQGWNFRSKRNSNIQVIDVPVLIKQSLMSATEEVLVVRRNPMKVLPRQI